MSLDINEIWNKEQIQWIKDFKNPYIWLTISTYIILVPGNKYLKVYTNIIKRRNNMDFLIALAIHISFIFSFIVILIDKNLNVIWEPIGLLYAFESFSKKIEMHIANKNDFERQKLESLQEDKILLKNGEYIKIQDAKIGDVISLKSGDIIQLDGSIEDSTGYLDTSNINGESKPFFIKHNSNVISGSKVLSKKIYMKVQKTFENSTLNKFVLLINKTNRAKPHIQNVADKIYKIMIPLVLLITIFATIIWILLGRFLDLHPFVSDNHYIYNSFLISVSILAIACPCAMTMTAPLINFVSSQSYWRCNIIFNKILDMEKINKVNSVTIDKTGTLTTNNIIIKEYHGKEKYHKIASSLEKKSHHPIGIAIYKKFKNDLKIENLKEIVNEGVFGNYEGEEYSIRKTTKELIEKTFNKSISNGTYVGLYKKNKLMCFYVLESELKPFAQKFINFLKKKNMEIIILSGDNEKATKEIANKLDIHYRANQTPEDKAIYIQSRQKENKIVLMIGDGLNDSIAIKYSDVSVSFASGSNISNSYSSVSLLSEDLNNLIFLFEISKKTKWNYVLAIFWAIGFNLLFLPFAATGFLWPWMSSLIMFISNLILLLIIWLFSKQLKILEKHVYGKTHKKGKLKKQNNIKKMESCH